MTKVLGNTQHQQLKQHMPQGLAVTGPGKEQKDPKIPTAALTPHLPMPIHGDIVTFNMNGLLRDSILSSKHFRQLMNMSSFEEIKEEARNVISHVEPWIQAGSNVPSSMFCVLYRLFTVRLTFVQMTSLITPTPGHSPYLRCLGALYIRYTSPPEEIWKLLGSLIDDTQQFIPTNSENDPTTFGEYVENLLHDYDYYGTRLPRYPTLVERDILAKLKAFEEKRERKLWNLENIQEFTPGSKLSVYLAETDKWQGATLKFVNEDTVRVILDEEEAQVDDDPLKKLDFIEKEFQLGKITTLAPPPKKEETFRLDLVKLIASKMKEEPPKPSVIIAETPKQDTSKTVKEHKPNDQTSKNKQPRRRSNSSSSSPSSSSSRSSSSSSSRSRKVHKKKPTSSRVQVKGRKRSRSRSRGKQTDKKRQTQKRSRSSSSSSTSSSGSSNSSSSSGSSSPSKSKPRQSKEDDLNNEMKLLLEKVAKRDQEKKLKENSKQAKLQRVYGDAQYAAVPADDRLYSSQLDEGVDVLRLGR